QLINTHIKNCFHADHGANINATRDQGSTPLHDAAKFGHPDIAELLLQQGAEKNLTTSRGKTALYLAVSEGIFDGLRWVLEAVIEYYHYRGYCYNDDFFPEDVVEYLLTNEKQVKALGMSDLEILRKALLSNDMDAIKLILREKPTGAAKQRHLHLVKLLLEAGIDPEIHDEYETGPLENAVNNKDVACIQLLIQNLINANRLGSLFGCKGTPLHSACNMAGATILKLLLENGADPNRRDAQGQTPLHIAVREKDAECVHLLLAHGACVDVVDNDGKTPLHEVKTLACAKFLVDHGANVRALTKNGQTVLFSAADRTGEGSCVKYLVEQGVDPLVRDEEGVSALDLAIRRYEYHCSYDARDNDDGGSTCAKILLEHGARTDTSKMNILTAICHRKIGLLTVLLHSEVNVDSLYVGKGKTALFQAAECNLASAVQLLIEKGADPNLKCNNMSPLFVSLVKGCEGSARVLIEAGASIDKEICKYSKALRTFTNVLKQLSDVNRQDEDGVALLHVLSYRGQQPELGTLFEAGANVNITDKHGVTPLHLVSFNGCKRVVEMLLTNKAEVNQQDVNGRTPLHYAAFKDAVGSTPLHKAQTNGLVECIKLLVEEEGEVSNVPNLGESNNKPTLFARVSASIDVVQLTLQR
ncbi:hypothetical protein C0J52_25880, partial [Blattella germanica]